MPIGDSREEDSRRDWSLSWRDSRQETVACLFLFLAAVNISWFVTIFLFPLPSYHPLLYVSMLFVLFPFSSLSKNMWWHLGPTWIIHVVISRSLTVFMAICDTVYRFWGLGRDKPFWGHCSAHWKDKVHLPCKADYQGGTTFISSTVHIVRNNR